MIKMHLDPVLIGERIAKARRENHYTQVQLAKMAGCSVGSLRKIERGEAKVSLELLFHLANLLNRTYAYFFCDEDRQTYEERLCIQILDTFTLMDDHAFARLKKMVEDRAIR
ncbi:MAG: helix-turn-helix transcriptional regulator [Clostridia bacterium]|nr:helix-turn-helix transcriptional regulator [Clostridia bacterium]